MRERLVEIEFSIATWRALFKFKYLTPSQHAALKTAVSGASGDYVTLEMAEVDAEFLAGDLSHQIVHGRSSARTANLLDDAATAIEIALSQRRA